MQAIEVMAQIDAEGNLSLDQPLPRQPKLSRELSWLHSLKNMGKMSRLIPL